MTSEEFACAALWEQAICLDCDAIFDPAGEGQVCPACGSDAVFLARDLEKIEAWLAELEGESE